MMDTNVEFGVCILCTDFANNVIWESWRSDDDNNVDERRIGFVTHPRPENTRFVPFSVDQPLETKWGDNSLVEAELYMIAQALQRFPSLKHLIIVSGDTVPIRTKEDFLEFFVDNNNDSISTVVLNTDVKPIKSKDPLMSQLKLRKLYNGHQFVSLSKEHAKYLTSTTGLLLLRQLSKLRYYTPKYRKNFNPDEVLIHTILANYFSEEEFFDHHFVEFVAEGRHAKTFHTLDDFVTVYETCIQSDTIFCIRKVPKHLQWDVLWFLGENGVTNSVCKHETNG